MPQALKVKGAAFAGTFCVLVDAEGSAYKTDKEFTTLLPLEGLPGVRMVAAEGTTVLAVDFQGVVWLIHQTGAATIDQRLSHLRIYQITRGYRFLLAQDEEGKLWGWGTNSQGHLGVPGVAQLEEVTHIKVEGLPTGPFRCLSAGWDFSFLIDCEGGAWACGNNEFGQMANGSLQKVETFTKMPSLPPLESASVGGRHVLAKGEEKETWVWGCNAGRRLGLEEVTPRTLQHTSLNQSISNECRAVLFSDGSV